MTREPEGEGVEKSLRSGEVAQRAGVNVETLRFYEREGLLPEPPRQQSGQRCYPPETVELIRFIKRAQALGLSLREVHELLELDGAGGGSSAPVRGLLEGKLAEVERKIGELQAQKQMLAGLLDRCDGRGAAASCPIIRFLKHPEDP